MSFVNFDYNAHTSWVMDMLMNVFCWPCLHKTRILCLENNSLRILGPPSLPPPIVGLFHWVGDVCVSLMLQFCQCFVKAKCVFVCVCVCVSYVVNFFGVL
jgi:hypothetical protein